MNIENKFDTYKELKCLSIDRLFVLQKKELQLLEHYYLNDDIYSKSDVLNSIKELFIINSMITRKLLKNKKCQVR